jgi:hypothetical protein
MILNLCIPGKLDANLSLLLSYKHNCTTELELSKVKHVIIIVSIKLISLKLKELHCQNLSC